jgi:hypothetical protein
MNLEESIIFIPIFLWNNGIFCLNRTLDHNNTYLRDWKKKNKNIFEELNIILQAISAVLITRRVDDDG